MAVIHVPRPSKEAMDPDRPANALLLAQVSHLQHAERQLPLRYRSEIYTHAIKTEGEAASYIREVTEAIHQAHAWRKRALCRESCGARASVRLMPATLALSLCRGARTHCLR